MAALIAGYPSTQCTEDSLVAKPLSAADLTSPCRQNCTEQNFEANILKPKRQLNYKLVTSEISKTSCPGSADTNEKYEKLMDLVEEELSRRSEFIQVDSEAEACCLLSSQPDASIHVMNATRAASDEELLLDDIHTEAFIAAMKGRTQMWWDAAEAIFEDGDVSAGWSGDTELAARTGVASLIDCAKDVFARRYANGFVLARPPSHHAVGNAELARNGSQKNLPFGFCHLNSIASAIANLRVSCPELRVCIFDFDVHPGNGNEDTFWNDPRTLTISIHEFDIWPGKDTCRADYVGGPNAVGSVVNFPILVGSGDTEYYHVVQEHIFSHIREFAPDIIFVAAGYDALEDDAYADQKLTPDWYGWCIAKLMSMHVAPLVLNLEGGYTPENVVKAICKSIDALNGKPAEHFLNCMSIGELSEDSIEHNRQVCEERRKSLAEKLSSASQKDLDDASRIEAIHQENSELHIDIVAAAAKFKADVETKKASLESDAEALTGKINKKARSNKLKEALELTKTPEYIDACCVVLGQPPKFGHFVEAAEVKAERHEGHVESAAEADIRAEGHECYAEEATKFKQDSDAKKAVLEAEAEALTGKINKNARSRKLKEARDIVNTPEYIDACRVVSGQPSKFGNFAERREDSSLQSSTA